MSSAGEYGAGTKVDSLSALHTSPLARPVMVRADSVSKTFRLPHQQVSTLKERALHPLRQHTFDHFQALKDVSFAIEQGEFFGIIGRNGSGKSTLLKCLAGIYQPNAGAIEVRGRLSPFIELGVGFNPDLPARDNILINATLLGMHPKEVPARFDAIIEYAELAEFIDLKFKNYSSGMQVRLGFASAIQVDADILLVDEVLAVGDANFQQKCFNTFREIKHAGRTVVYVTHDLETVERFCDRALYLEGGRVAGIGKPADVIAQYMESNLQRQRKLRAPVHVSDVDKDVEDSAAAAIQQPFELMDVCIEDTNLNRQTVVRHGEEVVIRATLLFNTSIEHPVVNMTLHADGAQRPVVFWASSETAAIDTPVVNADERLTMSLSFHNLLVTGRYHVSIVVTDRDGNPVGEKYSQVLSFLVVGSLHETGQIVLPHSADAIVQTPGGAVTFSSEKAK